MCLFNILFMLLTEVRKVVSINKGKVLLPCAVELDATVNWISPGGDHAVIEGATTSKFRNIAEVVGLKQSGKHHLLLKYSVYPDHVGLWLCVAGSPVLKTFIVNLTLLVPPLEKVAFNFSSHLIYIKNYYITCKIYAIELIELQKTGTRSPDRVTWYFFTF